MTNEDSQAMPNVAQIRAQATRVIRGRIPAQVRKELSSGVKLGLLGRLPKNGLMRKIIINPLAECP